MTEGLLVASLRKRHALTRMLPTHGMVRLSHHAGTHMVEAGGRCLIRKYGTTVVRAQAIKRGWSDSDVVTREFEVCSTCQRAQLFAS